LINNWVNCVIIVTIHLEIVLQNSQQFGTTGTNINRDTQ
jgi:hypothetical protein